jgi:energy-converting hydrogenase Eha subunit F
MRPLRALLIYIVVIFIGGALLAPWLYRLAQLFQQPFPQLQTSRSTVFWIVPSC